MLLQSMTPPMIRRNKGLLSAFHDGGQIALSENGPGDPVYSPTDSVTQAAPEYGLRYVQTQQQDPTASPGWWGSPNRVNPSQYIDQTVGGVAGDTKRLGWTKGLNPFRANRAPFTGAVLTPPRPPVIVAGHVGRINYRDNLALRVKAATNDYQPATQDVLSAMVNPQVGW
jgi:hypothetical protein